MEDRELQALTEKLSKELFGLPFMHKAVFNPRLKTTGGRYLLKSHNIEINKRYLEQLGYEELIGIIKHELCHYHLHLAGRGYKHRDADFRALLKKVEAPRFCGQLPEKVAKRTSRKIIVYECTVCKTAYTRRRNMDLSKYVCGKCRGKLRKIKEVLSET
ncbi:SprT family protein [Neobacillus notoginsengisoli]|uniref:Protein SprT-like n=1 Tax=Neobacillus notoginsengisoli TaxID=1578198 RepID=A0A417YD77_9BACI|nr:SprT family protein [Neobacillus notoginsengisoli]RHW30566.1 SprT family protein [Neobacillus notoginsengisoli]